MLKPRETPENDYPPARTLPRAESDRPVGVNPRTLLLIRWIAVVGQFVAVLTVVEVLGFPVALPETFGIIAALAVSNIWLYATQPTGRARMAEARAARLMAFDLAQLGALIGFTGGLTNPFALLLLGPVTVAATILSRRSALAITALALVLATALAFWHYPLPWGAGGLDLPPVYVLGLWTAIAVALVFIASYVWSVSEDSRRLSAALAETEAALAKERQMSALGALAAAAAHELGSPLATISVVTKELQNEVLDDDPLKSDIDLLREQAVRCREILIGLARQPDAGGGEPFERLSLTSLVEVAAENHVPDGVAFEITTDPDSEGEEPTVDRRPEFLHGVGNLIQNAGQFARGRVAVRLSWTEETVRLVIRDDGPGFAPAILQALGEPYVSTRAGRGGHLGLGIFIATTLLESIGATLSFRNRQGAEVTVLWPREASDGDDLASPPAAR